MKRTLLHFLVAAFALSIAGCSVQNQAYVPAGAHQADSYSLNTGLMQQVQLDRAITERKVLYSATIYLAVVNPDTASARINAIATRYGGYMSQGGTTRTVIRVRSTKLQAAVAEIQTLGKLLDQSITGQDVTDEYHDFSIRLENAERARTRYLALLEQAETVEEALKVEKELERLNETIDLLKGRMARIEHLEQFSTITVYHRERIKPGPVGYVGVGVWHVVKWLFVRN